MRQISLPRTLTALSSNAMQIYFLAKDQLVVRGVTLSEGGVWRHYFSTQCFGIFKSWFIFDANPFYFKHEQSSQLLRILLITTTLASLALGHSILTTTPRFVGTISKLGAMDVAIVGTDGVDFFIRREQGW
jgi:hypothetical protein